MDARRTQAETGEVRFRAVQTGAAEPAEELLQTMRGENETGGQAQQEQAHVHVRAAHGRPPVSSR